MESFLSCSFTPFAVLGLMSSRNRLRIKIGGSVITVAAAGSDLPVSAILLVALITTCLNESKFEK